MTQPPPQPGQDPPPSDPAPGGAAARPSIGTLFASVTSQISGIVRDEIELNKTKLRSFASKSGKGAACWAGRCTLPRSSWPWCCPPGPPPSSSSPSSS